MEKKKKGSFISYSRFSRKDSKSSKSEIARTDSSNSSNIGKTLTPELKKESSNYEFSPFFNELETSSYAKDLLDSPYEFSSVTDKNGPLLDYTIEEGVNALIKTYSTPVTPTTNSSTVEYPDLKLKKSYSKPLPKPVKKNTEDKQSSKLNVFSQST